MSSSETQTAEVENSEERKLLLGHRMVMLDHIKSLMANNRKHLDQYRSRMLSQGIGTESETSQSNQEAQDDDSMFVLGDITITEQAATSQATNTTQQAAQQETQPEAKSSVPDWLKNAAIVAALLGTGAGGATVISSVLKDDHVAPAATMVDTDTRSWLEIDKDE